MSVITIVVIRTRTIVKVLANFLLLFMVVVGCGRSDVRVGHSDLRGIKPIAPTGWHQPMSMSPPRVCTLESLRYKYTS